MYTSRLLACLHALIATVQCFPTSPQPIGKVRDIYQFPKPTWIENLAVRRNGNVLVSLLTSPDIYEINPFTSSAHLLYSFPGFLSTTGIVEIEPDVFTVLTGNFSFDTFTNLPGTYAAWKVNLQRSKPKVDKITNIPEGGLLNGITNLNPSKHTVLIADSVNGVVYRLNTKTGKYKIVIDDPLFKGSPSGRLILGVNGIRVSHSTLVFTNSQQEIYGSVPINGNGRATGPVKIIAKNAVGGIDDFALDPQGNAFVAQGIGNQIAKITAAGVETEVAGNLNSTELPGTTSARFGRTRKDRNVLYVTTQGGLTGPINGTVTVGGKLAAVTV